MCMYLTSPADELQDFELCCFDAVSVSTCRVRRRGQDPVRGVVSLLPVLHAKLHLRKQKVVLICRTGQKDS